ncbi:hypothetical protein ACTJKO_07280 [Curtobacterium sp. 22159]|uniref:hypothetical protein n=1 Tax=Curtobacterium sp. 22159 TaxID=3453882 RepID=UPI003F83BD01
MIDTTTRIGDVWNVQATTGIESHGRVALLDADGQVLVQRDVDLEWVRHGGSEQCGGPSTAQVVVELP